MSFRSRTYENRKKIFIYGSGSFIALMLFLMHLGASVTTSEDISCGPVCVSYFNITMPEYDLFLGSTFGEVWTQPEVTIQVYKKHNQSVDFGKTSQMRCNRGFYYGEWQNVGNDLYYCELNRKEQEYRRCDKLSGSMKTCYMKPGNQWLPFRFDKYDYIEGEFMVVGTKKPEATVKWGISGLLGIDPYWLPLSQDYPKIQQKNGGEIQFNGGENIIWYAHELLYLAVNTTPHDQCEVYLDDNLEGYTNLSYFETELFDHDLLVKNGSCVVFNGSIYLPNPENYTKEYYFYYREFAPLKNYFTGDWSATQDRLGDGDFDRLNTYGEKLQVNQTGSEWVLNASGDYGIHRFDRSVEFDIESNDTWGGRVWFNLSDLEHTDGGPFTPTDLAFVGGYKDASTTQRDLVVAVYNSSGKNYIYLKSFYHNNDAGIEEYDQRFELEDEGYPYSDRLHKFEWWVQDNKTWGRLDGGCWNKITTGTQYTKFNRMDVGWVSSYNGGSIYIHNVTLYEE